LLLAHVYNILLAFMLALLLASAGAAGERRAAAPTRSAARRGKTLSALVTLSRHISRKVSFM